MRPIFIVALSALTLAGCAEDYSRAAVPDAAATMHQAIAICEMERHKSYSEFTACELAAERDFAMAVGFRKMDAFEVYSSRMQALAAERDDFRVSPVEAKTRVEAIREDFWADCDCKPRSGRRWNNDYIGASSDYPSGYDMGMGQGNHAMGPGPLNF